MIFLDNFRPNDDPTEENEEKSGLYEVYIPDENGDFQYLSPYADGDKYPDSAVAVPVESTVDEVEYFGAGQKFANVIGSSQDKRHEGTSWIDVYKKHAGPLFARSCCTDGQFYGWHEKPLPRCEGGNNVLGGHIIKGTAAGRVGAGGRGLYILPICHKHNTCSCGYEVGTGFYMMTRYRVPALKLKNYLRGERVRAAIAELTD